uniref:Uncharacterized protein n=1 Tax=viral metagenome TaxID=1070528 RepID=A0A6C0LLP2_9ZZZZ
MKPTCSKGGGEKLDRLIKTLEDGSSYSYDTIYKLKEAANEDEKELKEEILQGSDYREKLKEEILQGSELGKNLLKKNAEIKAERDTIRDEALINAKQIKDLESEKRYNDRIIEDLNQKIKDIQKQTDNTHYNKENLHKIQKLSRKVTDLKVQQNIILETNEEIQKKLDNNITENKTLDKTNVNLTAMLENKKSEIIILNDKYNILDDKLGKYSIELNSLNEGYDQVNRNNIELNSLNEGYNNKINLLNDNLEDLRLSEQAAKRLLKKCREEKADIKENSEETIRKLNDTLNSLTKKIDILNRQRQEMDNVYAESLKELNDRIKNLNLSKEIDRERLIELNEKSREHEKDLESMNKASRRLRTMDVD